jgi:hypothetical protein
MESLLSLVCLLPWSLAEKQESRNCKQHELLLQYIGGLSFERTVKQRLQSQKYKKPSQFCLRELAVLEHSLPGWQGFDDG